MTDKLNKTIIDIEESLYALIYEIQNENISDLDTYWVALADAFNKLEIKGCNRHGIEHLILSDIFMSLLQCYKKGSEKFKLLDTLVNITGEMEELSNAGSQGSIDYDDYEKLLELSEQLEYKLISFLEVIDD